MSGRRTEQKQKPSRRRYECTLCHGSYSKLTQHLRRVHQLSKSHADHERRKAIPARTEKRRRRRFICPDCGSAVCERTTHLRRFHKLTETEIIPKLAHFTVHGCASPEEQSSAINKGSERDVCLRAFRRFLMDPLGFNSAERAANQHVRQVRSFWCQTGDRSMKAFAVPSLKAYVTELVENVVPGTALSFISSIRRFLEFGQVEEVMANTEPLHQLLKRASRLLKSKQKDRDNRRMAREQAELFTPEATRAFLHSSFVTKTFAEAGRLHQDGTDPSTLYQDYRNCVMVELVLYNAARPSVLQNMTVDHVRANVSVERCDEEGQQFRVMSVPDHKTSATHGPANVVVTVQQLQRIYELVTMSEELFGAQGGPLFLATNGKPAKSTSQMNKWLGQAWAQSGCEKAYGHFSVTKVRKSVTTAMRQHQPDIGERLAEQLCHSKETADRYYRLKDKQIDSVQTVGQIAQLFGAHQRQVGASRESEPEVPNHSASSRSGENKGTQKPPATDTPGSEVRRSRLPNWVEEQVRSDFPEFIETYQVPPVKAVRRRMGNYPGTTVQQIVDKAKAIVRKETRTAQRRHRMMSMS